MLKITSEALYKYFFGMSWLLAAQNKSWPFLFEFHVPIVYSLFALLPRFFPTISIELSFMLPRVIQKADDLVTSRKAVCQGFLCTSNIIDTNYF
jgi:hypothetical protein